MAEESEAARIVGAPVDVDLEASAAARAAATCPRCAAACMQRFEKEGTQLRVHFKCGADACPYRETLVSPSAFMRRRSCGEGRAVHCLRLGADGAEMRCVGCKYTETA